MRNRIFGLIAALGLFAFLVLPASAALPTVTMSSKAWLLADGQTAAVHYTVTCTEAGSFTVSGSVIQIQGRTVATGNVSGFGSPPLVCEDGDTVSGVLLVSSQTEAFKAGPATALVSVQFTGTSTFGGAEDGGTIKLKR